MTAPTYLDHNATTTLRPEAIAAVTHTLALTANPSSVHGPGRAARKILEDARSKVAALVGARPGDVIFTSGGTEASNLAIRGCGLSRVLVSATEHPSVLQCGGDTIHVDGNGVIDLAHLDAMLAADDTPALVSVMLANNESGVIQPVADVAAIAHRHGAVVHCDAVQGCGKIAVDMAALGVDFMSLSAHKIGGPAGAGALIVRGLEGGTACHLNAISFGGGHERGLRAGTENLSGIAGLAAAAEAALNGLDAFARLSVLRDALENGVRALAPATVFISDGVERLPNTSFFALAGLDSDTQVMSLDLAGVAISAGSACSSGKVKASAMVKAMNMGNDLATAAIRVSLGWPSTEDDVAAFLSAWGNLLKTKDILTGTAA